MNTELKQLLVRQKKILDDLLAEQTKLKLMDREKELRLGPASRANLRWIYTMTGEVREAIQELLD